LRFSQYIFGDGRSQLTQSNKTDLHDVVFFSINDSKIFYDP